MLYTGTFSKVLFPGLRLAYLVVPADQAPAFARHAERLHNHCPHLLQATVSAFLAEGHFARHLSKMRSLYARRRQWLVDALQAQFSDRLLIDPQAGGMHLVAQLGAGDDVELARRARAAGIAVEPLSKWFLEPNSMRGLILGFTNIVSAEQAEAVAMRLARVFAELA